MKWPPRTLRILLLEDDHIQAEWIAQELFDHSEDIAVVYVDSEYSFRQILPELIEEPPHIFVFDLLVRFYSVNDLAGIEQPGLKDLPSPVDAGLRLSNELRGADKLCEVPVILMSAVSHLDPASLPDRVLFWRKEDETMDFIRAIGSIAASFGLDLNTKKSTFRTAGSAAELKPSFMGFSVDVKKIWEMLTNHVSKQRLSAARPTSRTPKPDSNS